MYLGNRLWTQIRVEGWRCKVELRGSEPQVHVLVSVSTVPKREKVNNRDLSFLAIFL